MALADRSGMRPGVFAKAGDSGIAGYNVLYGLGCRAPEWDTYEWLRPTMLRYRETGLPAGSGPAVQVPSADERSPWNSFSRVSAAAASGIVAPHLYRRSSKFRSDLGWRPDPGCRPRQSMLDFEIRVTRPRYVLVNVGTNGANYGHSPERTAGQLSKLVRAIRRRGPVPVVCTIPPALNHADLTGRWDFARETGDRIRRFALKAGLPLIDQWQMLADERLLNFGLIEFDGPYFDGFHVETAGGFRGPDALRRSVDFSSDALLHGANLLNLVFLRALHELDSAVGA